MTGTIARRGLLIVLSSPSGAGKSTLARRLVAWDPAIRFSVSATTRAPRPGEVDGREYRFVSRARFAAMAAAGELLEHAEVFGNCYGSPRAPVAAALAEGCDTLFDIDWQGGRQVREAMGEDTVSVFLLPPSIRDLGARLATRAQDAPDVIARRMAHAQAEIGHWAEYDYVLVNRDLDACAAELVAIVTAERLRRARRPGLAAFVRDLGAEAAAATPQPRSGEAR